MRSTLSPSTVGAFSSGSSSSSSFSVVVSVQQQESAQQEEHVMENDQDDEPQQHYRRRRRQRQRQRQRRSPGRRPLQAAAAAAVFVIYLTSRQGVVAVVGGGIPHSRCCRFVASLGPRNWAAFTDRGVATTAAPSSVCHLANVRRIRQRLFLRRKCHFTMEEGDVPWGLVCRSKRVSLSPLTRQSPWVLAMAGKEEQDEEKGEEEDEAGEDDAPASEERILNLEQLVASQAVEIVKLQQETKELRTIAKTFELVLDLLRQAKAEVSGETPVVSPAPKKTLSESTDNATAAASAKASTSDNDDDDDGNDEAAPTAAASTDAPPPLVEFVDDAEIFGSAPSSVMDAADAAGSALLAALLGGKRRLLVDVRDAELSEDAETLVQFIELAILPVASGFEGLKTMRNRVKLVFPTVSQLWAYRRSMALSSPDVVALSTLAFDPVESRDSLVVIVAPHPSDEEGLEQMNQLLRVKDLPQQVVVLNYHMAAVTGPAAAFEVCYQLRLLNVRYMPIAQDANKENEQGGGGGGVDEGALTTTETDTMESKSEKEVSDPGLRQNENGSDAKEEEETDTQPTTAPSPANANKDEEDVEEAEDDAEFQAAMVRARQIGAASMGQTRAMVIRAYPRPWHIFVDTSPDTDADFVVAATFDQLPTPEEVNFAIVECLEGSEREDELVAQQMQQALEAGQLNHISELLTQMGVSESDQEGGEEADPFLGEPSKGLDYYVISGMSDDHHDEDKEEEDDKKKPQDDDNDNDDKDDFNYYDDFDDLWKNEDSV